MNVIYIAGMSHSGSTILNLMLNAHPDVFSVGELIDLQKRTEPRVSKGCAIYTPCACGAPSIWECSFWSQVNKRTLELSNKTLADLDILKPQHAVGTTNEILFRAVADISGSRFIVDSSKRPGRLNQLLRLEGVRVFPVHLFREPHGQVASLIRRKGGLLRSIYSYVHTHSQIRTTLKSVPHSVARYEDLVRDPENTLRIILRPLGLEFRPQQLQWSEAVHHTLGGNNLRWQPRGLVLDERWKEHLSQFQQTVISMATASTKRRLKRLTTR